MDSLGQSKIRVEWSSATLADSYEVRVVDLTNNTAVSSTNVSGLEGIVCSLISLILRLIIVFDFKSVQSAHLHKLVVPPLRSRDVPDFVLNLKSFEKIGFVLF